MLLYVDILSERNDEMFSDAFPVKRRTDILPLRSKIVDDIVYEVDCQLITVKSGADVDIGLYASIMPFVGICVSSAYVNTGANPSAEDADEALEDGATQVNNVVHSFRLQSTSFDKKSYLTYLKASFSLLEKLPEDRREAFEKGAQAYAKKIVANFKDYEFYTGENMDAEGMVGLLNYREDGVTPYFTFWKDGLKEVKL
ncbi:hypothetical protein C0993_001618 [Termitomyces sp. T159_Od127]|nr:hypothetical protein C0993_001618 [Termitomyces sp. T159_Od127]